MPEDRAANFLQMIRRSQRGRLKIYLGYGPGVGKTYLMLQEGHRLNADGIDVVVGLVETHGRAETVKLVEGLELIPRRKVDYRGITIEEMDVDAILARKPQVALIDELAHTNAPDSRNPKRYQDVQEIIAAGIHVITTLNVQHLESLYNTVEKLLGVKVRERIPDSVLADADEVINVDLGAEDLQRRLREGKIYPKDRVASALDHFFTGSNLQHLRELTMRELASQLDLKRREVKQEVATGSTGDQVMVCLSSRGPNSARLLRYGSRLAGRMNRNWYAVYVQTPSEEPTTIDAMTQRLLADTLTLANQLGATVFTFKGQDVADTILRFAGEYRVANIVIGRPRPLPLFKRLAGRRTVADELIHRPGSATVIVVDVEGDEAIYEAPPEVGDRQVFTGAPGENGAPGRAMTIASMLTPDRVVIFDDAVSRQEIFERLARAVRSDDQIHWKPIVASLMDREKSGSTFLNEGVALPHARIEGLTVPQIALAVTREGVLDVPTEIPVDVVFMLLSPTEGADSHLKLLAKAARMLQSRELRRRLTRLNDSAAVLEELRAWEQTNGTARG